VRVFAPAKLNLFLHVTGKRSDGFHDLQSLVAFADIGDELALERSGEFSLDLEGPFAAGLAAEPDNLVLRAARALAAAAGSDAGARFKLTKNLPVASGIGGGSADAAAALRGLRALWAAGHIDDESLRMLAAGLGSDIPVCVGSAPAFMEGRGERVTPLPALPETHLVLVNPGVSVPTAQVFRRLVVRSDGATFAPPPAFADFADLVAYLETTRNDLEPPARTIAPEIGKVLDALSASGARFTRMSGSGATCFGLFETAAGAQEGAAALARAEPGWWVEAGRLADADAARPVA
jgi:4-diphosphocytidyl-2-C-methyl-D-erythritol kinase